MEDGSETGNNRISSVGKVPGILETDSQEQVRSNRLNKPGDGDGGRAVEHQTNPAGGGRALSFQRKERLLPGLGLGLGRVDACSAPWSHLSNHDIAMSINREILNFRRKKLSI